MASAKYKTIFKTRWDQNTQLFQRFFLLNAEYTDTKNRKKIEAEFQKVGKEVREILQKGEDELCRQMEKSNHRVFSSKVADKYWDEVRKYFKYIDFVGVTTL